MAYDSSQVYAKFQNQSSEEDCNCSNGTTEECGCCPPGLVFVDGKGCLTPNDANEYMENKPCDQGYVMLYDNGQEPPVKLGCVSESEFPTLYAAVNPSA